jgi:hypothetical protein
MADATPLVNGQARERIAATERGMADCQARCTEHRAQNRADHEELFTRVRDVETNQERLMTRFSVIASIAVFVATIVAQVLVKLVVK